MTQPATPLPAATVVLLRRLEGGRFEVFLNRRPERMETYANTYVFPGGRVESSDFSTAALEIATGVSMAEAQRTLGSGSPPESCLAYWIAAARELFEESGVHFFYPAGGAPMTRLSEESSRRLATKRVQLQRGEIGLAALLADENLRCDLTALSYFFHRVTPEHYPIRFDTRFFLAILPVGQTPLHASEEVSESLWVTPEAALARSAAAEFRMMPPTLAVLRSLNEQSTWEDLCNAYKLRSSPLGSEEG